MDFRAAANQYAQQYGIPPGLFARLVQQESSWRPDAVSHAGAIGLAQLMPGTARELGVNPQDPMQNLEGGARYLRQQYDRFGSWPLALAAYNAGPGRVASAGGIPDIAETQNYVNRVWGGFSGDTGALGMTMNPDPQGQQRPGLFARIGNFFGAGDPNAGQATDPFQGLSRAQRTMLGFAALRDAAASLEGRDTSFFNEALGGFESARERERLREQGEFANRNQAIQNLIHLEALAASVPGNPGLQQLVNTQRELLLGQAGLPSGASVTDIAGGGGVPSPMPVDFTGGNVPADLPAGPQGATGAPQTGVVYGPDSSVPMPYDGAPEVVQTGGGAPTDPLAQYDAELARIQGEIDQLIASAPDRGQSAAASIAGVSIDDPQAQLRLQRLQEEEARLLDQRNALIEGQSERQAAQVAREDDARQARFYRDITSRLLENPNLGGIVGRFEGTLDPQGALSRLAYNEGEREALSIVEQLQGANFLQARDQLRGTGTITDFESRVATNAMSRLSERGVSEQAYRQALTEVQRVFENAEARALGQPIPHPDIAEEVPVDDDTATGLTPAQQALVDRYSQ